MASRLPRSLALAAAALLAAIRAAAAQTPTPVAPLRLSFADAVGRAAGTAPAVEITASRTEAARAQVRQARASLFPTLSVSAGWLNRTFNSKSLGISFPAPPGQGLPSLIGPFDNYDARLGVSQTVVDFASRARVRAARQLVTGSEAAGAAVVEGVAQAAALAYLRAVRAAAVLAARQADSGIATELLALAQAQREAGVSAAIDVTRARTQLVTAQGALVVARNQLDRAKIDLARALGLDPATPIELTDTLRAGLPAAELPTQRDSAVGRALGQRPDLATERARAEAARRTVSAIAAERLPRLGLAADYGLNGLTPRSVIATRQIGLQVTVPLLDGFRREARIAEQQAAVRESETRARDLMRQVAADVDGALLDLQSAAAQQAIAAERLQLAQDELAQARERFAAGVAGNIEVIDAQFSLLRARDTDIDARFAAAAAQVALAGAVGAARTLH